MPDITKAGTKAVGPGKQVTDMFASMAARTNKKAGSEMPGVPASETKPSFFPCFN